MHHLRNQLLQWPAAGRRCRLPAAAPAGGNGVCTTGRHEFKTAPPNQRPVRSTLGTTQPHRRPLADRTLTSGSFSSHGGSRISCGVAVGREQQPARSACAWTALLAPSTTTSPCGARCAAAADSAPPQFVFPLTFLSMTERASASSGDGLTSAKVRRQQGDGTG